MHVKDIIDNVVSNIELEGTLHSGDYREGFQNALKLVLRNLDILLLTEDIDEVLDGEHDAVFYFQDDRLYRLDKVNDPKGPFVEPLVSGYGGKKRYVSGTNLNGLLPGVLMSAPNFVGRW